MSNTIVVIKKDNNVRGSIKFFNTDANLEAISEEESEAIKRFIALVERMNDDE